MSRNFYEHFTDANCGDLACSDFDRILILWLADMEGWYKHNTVGQLLAAYNVLDEHYDQVAKDIVNPTDLNWKVGIDAAGVRPYDWGNPELGSAEDTLAEQILTQNQLGGSRNGPCSNDQGLYYVAPVLGFDEGLAKYRHFFVRTYNQQFRSGPGNADVCR